MLLCWAFYRQPGALASLPPHSNPDRFPHPDPYSDCYNYTIANAFLDAYPDSADPHPDCYQHTYGDPYWDGHDHSDRHRHDYSLTHHDEYATSHCHPNSRNAEPYARYSDQHTAADGDRHPAANQYFSSCQRYPDADTNNDAGGERYTWDAGTGRAVAG